MHQRDYRPSAGFVDGIEAALGHPGLRSICASCTSASTAGEGWPDRGFADGTEARAARQQPPWMAGVRAMQEQLPGWRNCGFTLIEIVIVILIVGIVVGLASFSFLRDNASRARDEAEHLALLLGSAQQEAVLQGKILALGITDDGYQFLHVNDKGKLAPIERDDVLAPYRLPRDMSVRTVTVEGAKVKDKTGIVLDPSGNFPNFTIALGTEDAEWHVIGKPNGQIFAEAPGAKNN
jgi:general secretion pathway protein H